jgi:N-acetylmuramoyl-L-alanine amidase
MNLLRNILAPVKGLFLNLLTGQSNSVPKLKSMVAICVGHSRKINGRTEGGAVAVDGTQEWAYNNELAGMIWRELRYADINCFVVDEYHGTGYTDAMKWLASHLDGRGAKLAIELHFNASSGGARGHEWLHWGSSLKSQTFAEALHDSFKASFPAAKDRGVKGKSVSDRGAEFLRLTKCPAVIAEPGFGDNTEDWRMLTQSKDEVAKAIANGIIHYLT